jgi:hypothetical protein
MYPGTFISVSTGINQHDCDGVVPSKNASTAVQKIDAIAKMVRSLAFPECQVSYLSTKVQPSPPEPTKDTAMSTSFVLDLTETGSINRLEDFKVRLLQRTSVWICEAESGP